MVELKSWVMFVALLSGLLLISGDDHEDIVALKESVAEQGQKIKSLDSTTTIIGAAVTGLKRTVDAEGKEVDQLKTDVDTGKSERAKLRKDLDDEKDKRVNAMAQLVKKLTEEKENASRRMENLETKLLEEITLSSTRYQHVTGLLRNETERSQVLEQRLKAEEEKSANLQKKLDNQDGVISKIKESQGALVQRVEEVFELLPNATFPNGSSVFHRKLEKLGKMVTEDQRLVVHLRSDVDADSKKLTNISGLVKSLDGSVVKLVNHDQYMDQVIKVMRDAQKKDLEKFHHEQYGFRYTGRGWSYYRYDQISKKGVHLKDCLQFCQLKREMDHRYNGVNFFTYPGGRNICYCVKGAIGFNPNENAMRFLA